MGSLAFIETTLARVGWFIPPYVALGPLERIAKQIDTDGDAFGQDDLEAALAPIYDAEGLAAMVVERYPRAPVVQDYRVTIAEAVEAHFLSLDHIAVGGLVPVIEGAGRQLARARGLPDSGVKQVFAALAADCKNEATTQQLGAWTEIESMMDSFSSYTNDYLYINSVLYPLHDRTNRHGILHGAYSDRDYGRPLNFYKTIAAVDFLTFISSFRARISWLAPSPTPESNRLAYSYLSLRLQRTVQRKQLNI
jgi:hypothetical protein